MKWIYRLMTFAILAAAITFPFFMDNHEGEPMLSLPSASDFIPPVLKPEAGSLSDAYSGGERTVYKWQDEHGTWHYGDLPPENAQQPVATISVNTQTNIIQSVPVEQPAEAASASISASSQYTAPTDAELLSLDRAMNILNETKAVRDVMESRNSQLNAIVGENQK